jgi:hypothetical protein
MTSCMEPLCDLRESAVNTYVTITYREAGKTVREFHWIFSQPGAPPGVWRWEINKFMPGRGWLQIGDRVRYKGKNAPGSNQYVEDVPIGTLATVTADNGWDYRYTFEFDKPTAFHIWSRHPEGEYQGRTGMRTGGNGWEKIA